MQNFNKKAQRYFFAMDINAHNCSVLKSSFHNFSYVFNGLDGIPENCIINLCVSTAFFTLFVILKYYAWRRGKLGLVHIYQTNFIQLFYSNIETIIMEGNPCSCLKPVLQTSKKKKTSLSFIRFLKEFCQNCKLSSKHLLEKCGPDSYLYLMFQQRIITFFTINTSISLLIILPLNLIGTSDDSGTLFSRTTVSNLYMESPIIWVHIIMSLITVIILVLVMRGFTSRILKMEKNTAATQTILLSKLSPAYCFEHSIFNYYRENYPLFKIEDVKLVYRYKPILAANRLLWMAEEALEFCNYIYETFQEDVIVKKRCWRTFYLCNCDCGCNMGSGREFYKAMIQKFQHEFINKINDAISEGPTKAFVTFKEQNVAESIKACEILKNKSMLHRFWNVNDASSPGDILWENIGCYKANRLGKMIIFSILIGIVMLFFTTPAVMFTSLDVLKFFAVFRIIKNPLFSQYISSATLTLLTLSLLPLVTFILSLIPYQTKSSLSRSLMKSLYFFMIFSIVILPTIGLTSLSKFMLHIMDKENEVEFPFQCIFLPDNGAFFVNYVITSAFLGNLSKLFRASAVVDTFLRLMLCDSEADKIGLYKESFIEFTFGAYYAYILLNFTLVNLYSIAVPVIAPFGLIYMYITYSVQKYTLCFTYKPSRESSSVHLLATRLMFLAIIIKTLGFFALLAIRTAWSEKTKVMLVFLIIILFISFYNMDMFCFRSCYKFTSKRYKTLDVSRKEIHNVYFPQEMQNYLYVFEYIYNNIYDTPAGIIPPDV